MQMEDRTKKLQEYLSIHGMTIQNLADAVEMKFCTIYNYMRTNAVSEAREMFWMKVNEVTGLNLEINTDAFLGGVPVKKDETDNKQPIPKYIPEHLKTFGNCMVGEKLLKRVGVNKLLEYLEKEHGLRCACITGSESKARILVTLK